MNRFDPQTWRRLKMIAKPFFVSELRWKAIGLLLLLAAFSISITRLNVWMSFIGRDFMTSLSLRERDDFFRHLYRYLFAFLVTTPVVVFYRYTEERLGLLWRNWLSKRLIGLYFTNRAYYRVNSDERIDNPDQRISEDVRSFTTTSLSFLLIVFNSCIALVAFMHILWSISANLTIAVLLYAAAGSFFTYLLGRPLIGLNFAQLKKEADYRYKLINVRDNAESIAFYRGEKKEVRRVRQRLNKALDNLKRIINWNRNLSFFTTGYNYIVTILPTVIVAPLYLDGKIEFGVVTQAGFAFAQVLGALSIIVLNFGGLSAFAAVITRLGTFWESVTEDVTPQKRLQVAEGTEGIQFNRASIYTPKGDRKIISDLNFSLQPTDRLLIAGPSGSGKSSILRTLGGLWSCGDGQLVRPPLDQTLFLPQRPYMILGTFRSQLLYSQRTVGLSDRALREVLRKVGLEGTLERVGGFEAVTDWPNILSTGEQQRLAMARLLLARPKYAFLDEATTAIDRPAEEELYGLVQTMVRSYVSVGHRGVLERFHNVILELRGDGTWALHRKDGEDGQP